jgi:hypothetical protein
MKPSSTQIKLYTFSYEQARTWGIAALFIIGNILLPQACHLLPNGGQMLLPIYFFTLIGAFKYGCSVGLLTAVLSPLANYLLFGMPAETALIGIQIKSVLLALFAGLAAAGFKRISFTILLGVVLSYQVVGSMIEGLITGSSELAMQDFTIGIPGMLVQIVFGYAFLRYVLKR